MADDVLRAYSMGHFYLAVGNTELYPRAWRSKKALQIFKYLLINRHRAVSADMLMDIFWGEDGDSVRHALHTTVYRIRATITSAFPELADQTIVVSRNGEYGLDMDLSLWWDTEEFLSLLEGARLSNSGNTCDMYRGALDLYRGHFLPDDVRYDWTVPMRIRLMDRYYEAAVEYSGILLNLEKGQMAVSLLKEVARDTPLDEVVRCALIDALIRVGQLGEAIYQFIEIKTILREELGIDPGPNLLSVYKKALSENAAKSTGAFAEETEDSTDGAMLVSTESFRNVLELDLRGLNRYGTPVTMLKLSLKEYELIPERVVLAVVKSLRAVDVVSVNVDDDVVILLRRVETNDIGNIVNRVSRTIEKELGLELIEEYLDVSAIRIDETNRLSREELKMRLSL